jgi:hypothetical protein
VRVVVTQTSLIFPLRGTTRKVKGAWLEKNKTEQIWKSEKTSFKNAFLDLRKADFEQAASTKKKAPYVFQFPDQPSVLPDFRKLGSKSVCPVN